MIETKDIETPQAVHAVSRRRRRHARIDAVGRCFVQIGDGWEGSVLNLGIGGLLMRLTRRLTPGSSYLLKLFVEDHVLVAEARVVRLVEHGEERLAAMEFSSMPAEDAARLRRYIGR